MTIESLIRPNILKLKPYASARHEFTGKGEVFLDANENPFDTGVNRYPDPLQEKLKSAIGRLKNIPTDQIFLGNGSDEAIDLILRIFCVPGRDEIMVLPPTYGMYQVSADIADVQVKKVLLQADFQPDLPSIRNNLGPHAKVIFICSPNNPTGNLIRREAIEEILEFFGGIVVVDEAYTDFCPEATLLPLLEKYENLIVMQTLSKAWGMAAIRLGMAFASPLLISYFNKVKAPYNINILTQRFALERLSKEGEMKAQVQSIRQQKTWLTRELESLNEVLQVYPSDSNFLLVKVRHAEALYGYLSAQGVVVRNRSREPLCENCLRITIGTETENRTLLEKMNLFQNQAPV
ncbi:MAG TPA: histidinol-phosphate transaminase [Saprospiraceae bacterium]|nr:histidinol-phosphate transaminase [Saprospiraceae bacterium]HNT19970.1 histidinol-phosphate transaminase [Saprospiraceae bacterium]